MIKEIRKRLIIKYTAFFTVVLLVCFGGSYAAYRYSIINFMNSELYDYLSEEIWEAKEFMTSENQEINIYKTNSDINSLYNFTYWFVDKEIVHAETPNDSVVADELLKRLSTEKYESNQVYYENIKHNKEKWYFTVFWKSFSLSDGRQVEVFVLANHTPIKKSMKTYVKIIIAVIIVLVIIASLLGSWLASRSMKHIELMYNKQKEFVSDAAHELRTPLSILLSYAELLEHKPEETKIIGDIKEQIMQTNKLLDNLLAIARYDNDKILVRKETFDLNNLTRNTVASFSKLADKEAVTLKLNKQPVMITADSSMIRQLLYIMLDNAVKYAGKDKKIIVQIEKNKNETKIKVSDNGIGIKSQDIPHIFDRFWRADKSRNTEGMGLGLCLVDMIVRLHKGHINVASQLNKGTEFEIILPLKDEHNSFFLQREKRLE